MPSCSRTCSKTQILGYSETRRVGVAHRDNMGSSSNNRLAALTLWIVAASVAIALLGSSTVLFPGPDVGGQTVAPPGRDVVARVVAQIFAPAPASQQTPPPPPALEPTIAVPPSAGSALSSTAPAPAAERNPIAAPPSKARPDTASAPTRKNKATKAQRGDAVAGAKSQGHGNAVAGAKSQGHGHLKSEPPRGPKHSHVRPAKAKGKSAGHSRAHARARR